MYAEERRRQIASLTAVEGRVNVTELALRFGVTAETIRRDLAALHDEGVVHRVHGGAVANQSFRSAELPLDARQRASSSAKTAIAEAALRLVPRAEHCTIFLDSGTTISSLGTRLAGIGGQQAYSVVTNSIPTALELSGAGLREVQLLGGTVRPISQAVVGSTALRTLALIQADVAFVGTNALSVEHGLSTADAQEAAVKAAMVTNAQRVVVLCDSTKLGNDYVVSFAPLSEIDVVVTDAGAPPAFVEELRSHGVEVILASVEPLRD